MSENTLPPLRDVIARHGLLASKSLGQHFLLDTGTLCVLGYYRDIPAVRVWNGPLTLMSEVNGRGRDYRWPTDGGWAVCGV